MADTKFTTGKGRFSYPHVFEAYAAAEGQTPKFSTTFLIPKEDKETLKKLGDACKAVYEEHKNSTFKNILYDEVAKPYHDGDGRKPKGGEYGPECKGMWVLSTSSKRKPLVVDRDRQTGLNACQTFKYGEAIGGGASADAFDDGFEDDEDTDDLGL